MADLYVCPRCGGIEDTHRPPCPRPCVARGCYRDEFALGVSLCLCHARLEWVRFCEIVSACVIAACVEDYAEALSESEAWADPVSRRKCQRAKDALCGRKMP